MTTETLAQSSVSLVRTRSASIWVFLVAGILIRSIALTEPLIDAHMARQTQTADWTAGALAEGGWPLSAVIRWRGDTDARLTLEFPLYNYLVMGVTRLTGHLDLSGKLVSIALWALSFLVLQRIWKEILTVRQTFWANLIFVLAPLSVFFGQAFMPEMGVQLLALVMLDRLLAYGRDGRQSDYALFAVAGLLGLLVKSLEMSHLYLVAWAVFWRRDGIRLFRRPEHWFWGGLTLVTYLAWTRYVDRVNSVSFPAWTASQLSGEFLGTIADRFNWRFYFKVGAYVVAFLAGPIGLLIAVIGWRERNDRNRFGFWWLYSLAAFYLVWGIRTAGLHSYYNLPALGPLCFLFGLGMPRVLEFVGKRFTLLGAIVARVVLVLLLIGPWALSTHYLFRPDRTIYEAARWIHENGHENDLVVLRVNHRRDMNGYPEFPVFSYYAGRRTWVDTDKMGEAERSRAWSKARWAVMTHPPKLTSWAERMRDRIVRYAPLREITDWPRKDAGFVPVKVTERYSIFRREDEP